MPVGAREILLPGPFREADLEAVWRGVAIWLELGAIAREGDREGDGGAHVSVLEEVGLGLHTYDFEAIRTCILVCINLTNLALRPIRFLCG
jgi:hypothetical protein